MPRLAPRLVKAVLKDVGKPKVFPFSKPSKRKKSLHNPDKRHSPPQFSPVNHARSILLSGSEPNPITESRAYESHKSLPPVVFLPKGAKARQGEVDKPREMTEQERRWFSSPYLRMLTSPLRRCSVTDQYLPSDFLLRFSYARVPSSHGGRPVSSLAIIPDGLEHSKYTSRKGGHSFYTLCLRGGVDAFLKKQPYKRVTRDSPVISNSNMSHQVVHLLRLRVLQELERLSERMRYQIRQPLLDGDPHTILRQLSQDEFDLIESTGKVSFRDALAVLIVPPVEAEASMSPLPPPPENLPPGENLPPLSVLMPTTSSPQPYPNGSRCPDGLLPSPTVPVYNCLTAFPHPSQRAALHNLLAQVSKLEQNRERLLGLNHPSHAESPKLSNAFVLCSNQHNLRRGDPAAVAIALWRLRMFEGGENHVTSSWSLGTDPSVQKLL